MDEVDKDLEYDIMHSTWRVGRKLKRTIYAMRRAEPSDSDDFIGIMETAALASEVVCGHNIRRMREDARLAAAPPEVEMISHKTPMGTLHATIPLSSEPCPALFGMTHLKIGRDGSTMRRGVLDA